MHLEGRVATGIDPLLEELGKAAARHLLKGAFQVCRDDFALAIAIQVGIDGAAEGLLAELVTQHVQHPAAFVVHVTIEQFKTIIVIDMVDDGTAIMAILLHIAVLEVEHRLLEVIGTLVVFAP